MKQFVKLDNMYNDMHVYARIEFEDKETHLDDRVIIELMYKTSGFNFEPAFPRYRTGPHYSVISVKRLEDWHNVILRPNSSGMIYTYDVLNRPENKAAISIMINEMLSKSIKKESIKRFKENRYV